MRVASAFQIKTSLTQMQRSNSNLQTLTSQITSGLRAQRFEQIAGDANQLLKLQDLRANTEIYVKNLQASDTMLKAQESALSSISDLLVEAANLYTLARNENSAEVRATLAPKAQGIADTFWNTLTSQISGRYVFSGQASNVPPIQSSPSGNPFPGDPPPTTYYTGDSNRLATLSGPGVVSPYGVTGDNIGFARIVAGLEALIFGLENNSEVDMDGAIDLLRGAQKDIGSMLGQVGGDMAGFDLIKDRHQTNLIFIQERIDEVEKVDVAEAMSKFSQEEATLQASMLTITRLLNLRLLDFLR
jgi:flagellar hook-associated protein 3 FlgL